MIVCVCVCVCVHFRYSICIAVGFEITDSWHTHTHTHARAHTHAHAHTYTRQYVNMNMWQYYDIMGYTHTGKLRKIDQIKLLKPKKRKHAYRWMWQFLRTEMYVKGSRKDNKINMYTYTECICLFYFLCAIYSQSMHGINNKTCKIREFMYRHTTNVEHEMCDYTGNNWCQRNSNKSFKEKFGRHTRKQSIDTLQKYILGTSLIIRTVLQSGTWSLGGRNHRWFKKSSLTGRKGIWQETTT